MARSEHRLRIFVMLLTLGTILILAVGCSDDPAAPGSGRVSSAGADVDGQLDPTAGTFKLDVLTDPPPDHVSAPIELLGSNMVIDHSAETVSLDVAMRNMGNLPLYPPAVIWLGRFLPDGVTVENPDITIDYPTGFLPVEFPYGFVYTEMLGEDGVLTGGETSGARTWTFHVPDLTAFAFGARASFGAEPDRPRITGIGFMDWNRNGLLDGEEFGHPGRVTIQMPDGMIAVTETREDGSFALPVREPGLHRVSYAPWEIWDCICPVIFTTPNPLTVVLPPDADGLPVSFLDANFGFALGDPGEPVPSVVFSPLPVDSLQGDFYDLIAAELDGDVLELKVGFSGCDPDHPFTLYMSGEFMESLPVQANLVLDHDNRGEICLVHHERTLRFNVGPILARYHDEYGELAPVQLNFIDFLGIFPRQFLLLPPD